MNRNLFFILVLFAYSHLAAINSDTIRGKVETELNQPIAGATIMIADKVSAKSNGKGEFMLLVGPLSEIEKLKVRLIADGFQLKDYSYPDDNYLEIIAKKADPLIAQAEKEKLKELNLPVDLVDPVDSVLASNNFVQYKDAISQVVEDLKTERKRIEESNRKIQEDILQISEKLKTEKNLSPLERQELEEYISTLENTINENNAAVAKAQQKTAELLSVLKTVIMEKDAQIAKIEKEKEIAQKKLNRNLIIFSIITLSLLLLAIVFYIIASRMKKQKKELETINKDLLLQKDVITEQNEKLDIFVYRVSHDLKGPLRSIVKLAELAKIDKDTPPDELIAHIGKSAEKLTRLVEDMLKISVSKNDALEIRPVRFDELISDIIDRLGYLPEAKDMSITAKVEEGITFSSDERILLSVIQNMVENAIKYQDHSKSKRIIEVSAAQTEEKVLLTIKDNGIGIDESKLPKIFDMFFRANSNTSGTGLGLHITKMNVMKLGGTIEVSSKAGEGTTFVISFPNNEFKA